MVSARVKSLVTSLRSRHLWLLGLAALILFSAAFQIPYTYHIDFGERNDRFLISSGMYDPENDHGRTLRWTQANAIVQIPALTSGEWTLTLGLNGWQPKAAVMVQLTVGDTIKKRATNGDWETWQLQVNLPSGDARIGLTSKIFRPTDFGNQDTRTLGVRLDELTLAPSGGTLRLPPFVEYVLPMTAAVMLCYLNLGALAFRKQFARIASGLVLLGFLILVAFCRVYLNETFLTVILAALSVTLLFFLFGLDALGALYRRAGIQVTTTELNWLGLIVGSLLIIKWVGVLYPNIYIIDEFFHVHRLEFIEQANLFFVTRSREFASLETVYPSGLYILLSPLATLLRDELALLKVVMPLMDAAGSLFLFWIARKNGLDAFGALSAVLMYLAAPIAFIIFGWGVYTNVFAQFVMLVMLAAWFTLPWERRAIFSILCYTFFLVVGLLAHASMLVVLVVFWGLIAVGDFVLQHERRRAFLTAASLGLALLIAFGLYFSVFVDKTLSNLSALQARPTSEQNGFERIVGGGLADAGIGLVPIRVHSVSEWGQQAALYLTRETWVYYRSLVVVFAGIGIITLWRISSERTFALVLTAGLATVFIFFLVGMIFNLYTRYMLFGAPFFALGAGYIFERLWQKRTIGRMLVVSSLALVVLSGFSFWVNRVVS
ncbi:MAG TPA: hypothetical protein VFD70_10885 [Anaerolineae bacterium]|nr:hypothetical protein [Anaerolineae bacterium]